MEPAVGGAMVIACAQALQDMGINYQQHMHVTAVDVDERVAHMAYVQFSLLHIPAIVVVGNSLSLDVRGVWYTPAQHPGRVEPAAAQPYRRCGMNTVSRSCQQKTARL
jgi:hypothetical protein